MSLNHNAHAMNVAHSASPRAPWPSEFVDGLSHPAEIASHTASASDIPSGLLTEVFCQADSRDQLRLLVPTLAELSRQQKWITLIAPPCVPNERMLSRAGVDTRKILVIHTHTIKDYWQTLEQMLGNGMSSTVLAWLGREFDDDHRDRLKTAAARGGTAAFVLRQLGGTKNSATPKARVYNAVKLERDDDRQMSLAL